MPEEYIQKIHRGGMPISVSIKWEKPNLLMIRWVEGGGEAQGKIPVSQIAEEWGSSLMCTVDYLRRFRKNKTLPCTEGRTSGRGRIKEKNGGIKIDGEKRVSWTEGKKKADFNSGPQKGRHKILDHRLGN